MIIAPGEKVFGALLAIAGVGIILTGHWATTDDMIADIIAGLLMLAWGYGLTDVELPALTAALVRRGDAVGEGTKKSPGAKGWKHRPKPVGDYRKPAASGRWRAAIVRPA